jgi:hypothetical protein
VEQGVELRFRAPFGEDRLRVAIVMHILDVAGHQQAHEIARLAEARIA